MREPAEAFERFIGRGGPAYVERLKVTPAEAVEIIRAAGGWRYLRIPGGASRDEWVAEPGARGARRHRSVLS